MCPPMRLPRPEELLQQRNSTPFGEDEYLGLMQGPKDSEGDGGISAEDQEKLLYLQQAQAELQKAEAYQARNAQKNKAARRDWERIKNAP